MQAPTIDTLIFVPTAPREARNRLFASTAAWSQGRAEPETRLWKLASKVESPAQRVANTSLFVLIGSLALGAILTSIEQLSSFVGSDSLSQTVNALLHR